MSLTGTYTPFQLDAIAELLANVGLTINPEATSWMGISTGLNHYIEGRITNSTVLENITLAIRAGYQRIGNDPVYNITEGMYYDLISIGQYSIPALGNSKPSAYLPTYINQGALTSFGWLRLFPITAYNEFYVGTGDYKSFLQTFNTCHSFMIAQNDLISALADSKTFMQGTYSNMNDLITGDITGVSLSTLYWGQDIIASGRVIDLSEIHLFGNPDVLLRTLYNNGAVTPALNLALLTAGLEVNEIQDILDGNDATTDQQKRIYGAFTVITGNDLHDILVPVNCQTPGLTTLADLLDPKMLFPNSYMTLTYPKYNSVVLPTNSKTYYLIYKGTEVDITDDKIGYRLYNILPKSIAFACDAFSIAMRQIKNIYRTDIQKFGQVVTNLENVTDIAVSSGRKPVSVEAQQLLSAIAYGTGPKNTYTMCDFFGSMTNIHYDWQGLHDLIQQLQTDNLREIYLQIFILLTSEGQPVTGLSDLIQQANEEIDNIMQNNPKLAQQLNELYNTFGIQLYAEEVARYLALPSVQNVVGTMMDVITFVNTLPQYATSTQDKGTVLVLESIADLSTIGGNSLIGSMREVRNAQRLGLAGLSLDNKVKLDTLTLPRPTGSTSKDDPRSNYTGKLNNFPVITGASTTPGSLGGSPETTLIPTNLSIFDTGVKVSALNNVEAVTLVTATNCDCWKKQ